MIRPPRRASRLDSRRAPGESVVRIRTAERDVDAVTPVAPATVG